MMRGDLVVPSLRPAAVPPMLRTVLVDVARITKPSAALLAALAQHAESESLRRSRTAGAAEAAASPVGIILQTPTKVVSRTPSPTKSPASRTPVLVPPDGFTNSGLQPLLRHLVVPMATSDDAFRRGTVRSQDRTRIGRGEMDGVSPTVSYACAVRQGGRILSSAYDRVDDALRSLPAIAAAASNTIEARREKARLSKLATAASTRLRSRPGPVPPTPPATASLRQRASSSRPDPKDSPRRGFFDGVRRQLTEVQLHQRIREETGSAGSTRPPSPAFELVVGPGSSSPRPLAVPQVTMKAHARSKMDDVDWSGVANSPPQDVAANAVTMLREALDHHGLGVGDAKGSATSAQCREPCAANVSRRVIVSPRQTFLQQERLRIASLRGGGVSGAAGTTVTYVHPARAPGRPHGPNRHLLITTTGDDDPIISHIQSEKTSNPSSVRMRGDNH